MCRLVVIVGVLIGFGGFSVLLNEERLNDALRECIPVSWCFFVEKKLCLWMSEVK